VSQPRIVPRVSGFDVLAELHAVPATRAIPVVIVSATDTPAPLPNVKCRMKKPVTAEALIANIERCLVDVSST
jgi:CheY-like chemotaxis protein